MAGSTYIPSNLIDEILPRLGGSAFVLLCVLLRHEHKGQVQVSLGRLCSLTSLSENTVMNGLRELEDKGLIKKETGGRRDANTYTIQKEAIG